MSCSLYISILCTLLPAFVNLVLSAPTAYPKQRRSSDKFLIIISENFQRLPPVPVEEDLHRHDSVGRTLRLPSFGYLVRPSNRRIIYDTASYCTWPRKVSLVSSPLPFGSSNKVSRLALACPSPHPRKSPNSCYSVPTPNARRPTGHWPDRRKECSKICISPPTLPWLCRPLTSQPRSSLLLVSAWQQPFLLSLHWTFPPIV